MGEWGFSATILNVSTRWRCESASHPELFTPKERVPGPLDRKMGGNQSRSRRSSDKKNPALAGIQTPTFQPVVILTLTMLKQIVNIE
jgi:hypothetical protein